MASDPRKADSAEGEIPKAPPPGLRARYLSVSWSYIHWCLGMFAWAIGCVFYFIMTRNSDMMWIAIALGILVVLMVVLPTVLFGGHTWYKRLGWITVLLFLFSFLFVYPFVGVVVGLVRRIMAERYKFGYLTDYIHVVLAAGTVALHVWTIIITVRAVKLVKALARGDFGSANP